MAYEMKWKKIHSYMTQLNNLTRYNQKKWNYPIAYNYSVSNLAKWSMISKNRASLNTFLTTAIIKFLLILVIEITTYDNGHLGNGHSMINSHLRSHINEQTNALKQLSFCD